MIPGANQAALRRAHVTLVGAGGLGGEIGHGLVRKGIGRLTICDFDTVETSNLARQMFGPADVGQNKAVCLARNLAAQATGRTLIEGYPWALQTALERPDTRLDGDVAVVAVDNNATRLVAAEHYLKAGIPELFLAVDVRAARGYVFVQTAQAGAPCFLCLFPDAAENRGVHGCSGASIEILKIVAGIALYALDSLLMPRSRPWNYKQIFLDEGQDGHRTVGQRPGCPLCGGGV